MKKSTNVNLTRKQLKWNGWDCDGIYELVGHWNWSHKKGVLIVKNAKENAFIPKGEILEIDQLGNAISKLAPDEVDPSILKSSLRSST